MISQLISQKWWYQRRTMSMICSVKTWLSFFKVTLMDPLNFHWMQSPFSHLKNTWRLSIHLHWTLIKYLPFGIKFFEIQKQWSLLLRNYENVQGKYQLFFSIEWRYCNLRPGVPLEDYLNLNCKITHLQNYISAKLWGLKVIFKVRIAEHASIEIHVPPTWIQI
jgi:hypothetical protein